MREETLQVQGFQAAAVRAGIRGKDRLDLGLIRTEKPAVAAGVFTRNRAKAAPVLLDQERLQRGKAQAILVNSGIANACTGAEGMRNARITGAMAADALDIDEDLVQIASTGVIGAQLDVECFRRGMPHLVAELSPQGLPAVARAMMTTDTAPKTAVRTAAFGGCAVKFVGLAKGAGMIMPDMATMLCFILTDAVVDHDCLQAMLRQSVAKSFNAITVDGDTSTNDTVLLLANGLAANPAISTDAPERLAVFQAVLDDICKDLAVQIVRDGEGATKLVTVRVEGAAGKDEAVLAARAIANSNLVKTAFFGQDANWGRIIAALGRSGAAFAQEQVSIVFDNVPVVKNGLGLGPEAEAGAAEVLRQKELRVTVGLHNGAAAAEVYTCDFSLDYVKINADYRT